MRGLAQQVGRMQRRHHRNPLVAVELAAQRPDRRIAPEQTLRREICRARRSSGGGIAPSCLFRNGSQLATSSGSGLRFPGGRHLQHVADVDVAARVAHRLDHLGQELARLADERLALRVLSAPGASPTNTSRRPGCRRRTRCSCASGRACSAGNRRAPRARPAAPLRLAGRRRLGLRRRGRNGFVRHARAPAAAGAVGGATAATGRRLGVFAVIATPSKPDRPRVARLVRSRPTKARNSSRSPRVSAVGAEASSSRHRPRALPASPARGCGVLGRDQRVDRQRVIKRRRRLGHPHRFVAAERPVVVRSRRSISSRIAL